MKRYVVLGVNDNPKYLYYLPLVRWTWAKFDWKIFVFYVGDVWKQTWQLARNVESIPDYSNFLYEVIDDVTGIKSETLAQVSRLYACCKVNSGSDYLMTSDVDMIPLSNYHFENLNKPKRSYIRDRSGRFEMKEFVNGSPTCFGRDLTDYHYPISYIGMNAANWYHVMNIQNHFYQDAIERDLSEEYAKSKNKWCYDQDLITHRLLSSNRPIERIDRGTDPRTGYPIGRVDRSNWRIDHKQLIDAHLPHDILTNDDSYKKVCDLLKHVWPTEDFSWYHKYHQEFKKLL